VATLQSPESILSRRRNDHVLIEHLNASECPVQVTAHRSAADARTGADPLQVGHKNPPAAYRATFDFDTLIAPGRRHRPTHILIDPLANGEYPASEPVANVIGQAPWTPHFANGVPVCHGHRVWVPNRTQLVDYIIHLGRLLNFDEPPPGEGYTGYNGAAIAWWRSELNFRPLDPNLKFPSIEPTEVLAGRSRLTPAGSQGTFKRSTQQAGFSGVDLPQAGGKKRMSRAAPRSSRLKAVQR
jgi:hypothetical protein